MRPFDASAAPGQMRATRRLARARQESVAESYSSTTALGVPPEVDPPMAYSRPLGPATSATPARGVVILVRLVSEPVVGSYSSSHVETGVVPTKPPATTYSFPFSAATDG